MSASMEYTLLHDYWDMLETASPPSSFFVYRQLSGSHATLLRLVSGEEMARRGRAGDQEQDGPRSLMNRGYTN